jgi:cell shape-determining protein MreC
MIMSYRFGKKKENKVGYITTFAVLLVLGIVFRSHIVGFFGKPTSTVVEPLWQVSQLARGEIKEGFLKLQSKKSLIKNILHLQEKFLQLRDVISQNEILIQENEELKRQLGLYREAVYDASARVLRRSPQIAYDTLVIDLGSRDGIERGDTVFAGGGVYIGNITEVHVDTSLVTLLSTSSSETNAVFLNAGFEITLTGTGGGSFEGYIPKEAEVLVDDKLVSVQDGSWHIADVVRIGGDAQDPSKRVIAKNPLNMKYVHTVFVKRF